MLPDECNRVQIDVAVSVTRFMLLHPIVARSHQARRQTAGSADADLTIVRARRRWGIRPDRTCRFPMLDPGLNGLPHSARLHEVEGWHHVTG
jgi:hypothetical protein